MTMLKKAAAVAAMALVVLSGAGAAGKADGKAQAASAKNPVTLTLWDDKSNEDEAVVIKKIVEEWNAAHPEARIVRDAVDIESYKMKIKTFLAAGEAPDLFYSYGGGFSKPFVDAGKILKLDPYLSPELAKKALPATTDYCRYGDGLYALPINLWVGVLYVNRELLAAEGFSAPKTYDELMKIVKAFRAKGQGSLAVGASETWTAMFYYDALALMTAGADLSRKALAKEESFGREEFTDAAAKLDALVKAGAFNDGYLALNYDESVSLFLQGKIPMIFQGSWLAAQIEEDSSPVKGKVEVVNFPVTGGKGGARDFLGGAVDVYMVSAKTAYPKIAAEALQFISRRYSELGYARGLGLPVYALDKEPTEVSELTRSIVKLASTATSFVPAWDTFLGAKDADTHLNLVQQLFAGLKDPAAYTAGMKALD